MLAFKNIALQATSSIGDHSTPSHLLTTALSQRLTGPFRCFRTVHGLCAVQVSPEKARPWGSHTLVTEEGGSANVATVDA